VIMMPTFTHYCYQNIVTIDKHLLQLSGVRLTVISERVKINFCYHSSIHKCLLWSCANRIRKEAELSLRRVQNTLSLRETVLIEALFNRQMTSRHGLLVYDQCLGSTVDAMGFCYRRMESIIGRNIRPYAT